jgi:phage gp36-like protein
MPGPGGAPYVVRTELANYWPAAAFIGTTTAQQDQACLDATGKMDEYLSGRYQMPLLAWGSEVKKTCAHIAIYYLMTTRGASPANGADAAIFARYYDAVGNPSVPGSLGWLDKVQRQSLHPDITATVPPAQDPVYGMPQVFTSPRRGWPDSRNGKPVVG